MTATADVRDAPAGSPLPRLVIVAAIALALLYAAFQLYVAGQAVVGALLLALAVGVAIVFGSDRFYNGRFIFPGIATVVLFLVFPVLYTVYIGFTNYSSFNLLTLDRTLTVLLSRSEVDKSSEQPFAVVPETDGYRIWLPELGLLSDPVTLADSAPEEVPLSAASEPASLLAARDAIKLRTGLQSLTLVAPDGLKLQNSGLRTFAELTPEFRQIDRDHLERTADGVILTANHETGFFETPEGEQIPPGWRVGIGWDNFRRVLTSSGIREPMLGIFLWTVVFATLSVAFTFSVGLLLGVVLQWEHLRFKPLYRILLILPYAVPGFISILVFKGLFNQNFGEINLILEAIFGIRPSWFTNPFLARSMLLIVNTWLGYPYMMLLAMGFLQAVPADHKKAAALEGASALRVFFTITLPQILPPFVPLLIATFSFNFNNMVLILLLTRGGPDTPGTVVPAGQTDILASFTYRLAFNDSATQFGLAGAITLMIFVLVSIVSYANFVALRRSANKRIAK